MKNNKLKFIGISQKILLTIFIIISFCSFMTINYYHMFAHLTDYSIALIILQWLKITSLLLFPLAVFYNNKSSRAISKWLYHIVAITILFFMNEYLGITKIALTPTEAIYNSINNIFPPLVVKLMFILESILMIVLSVLIFIEDKVSFKELKAFKWLPLIIILVTPLNIFDNIVNSFSQNTYDFLKFKNFSIWHFLALFILLLSLFVSYQFLKRKSRAEQDKYLIILSILTMIHYNSKMSIVVGDGYNVYNTLFACIPLFICNIGEFIAVISIFTKKKFFYHSAFFIHAVGALTVFVYFGRDDMSNFGTIFNFSFLFFTISHLLLFNLCLLPKMLGHYTFKLKDCKNPLIYYAIVILLASFTSALVTNYSMGLTDSFGNLLQDPIYPNYAFTQINPLPIEIPLWISLPIGKANINVVYVLLVYIAYVALFFAFYFLQKFLVIGYNKFIRKYHKM